MTRFPRAMEKAIFDRDSGVCRICGRKTEFRDGDIEHIKSLSQGGSDDPENLQWACHSCNKLKGPKGTNEQVRKLLSLPEHFEEIMKLRQEEPRSLQPLKNQDKLPVLSREGLDQPAIEKCVDLLKESYQSETIIDEVCSKITAVEETTEEFVHIGFHYRISRLWFLPYETTNQVFCNDLLFMQWGKFIALGEQEYLEDSILKNKAISRPNIDFSPDGVLKAIDEMRSRGFEPSIITFPLRFWTNLHRWSGNGHVEYDTVNPNSRLNATLILGANKLKIINPIGSFPKEPLLIGKDAVEWKARKNPEGALYVVLGNHQLYPLKYVELLTGISVKSLLHSEGISILNFG